MALAPNSSMPDEVRCSFTLREGAYKLATRHEFSKPMRNIPAYSQTTTGYQPTNQVAAVNPHVRVSSVIIPSSNSVTLLCYNFGKEIHVCSQSSLKQSSDGSRILDKRFYKGTSPTCHDFNSTGACMDGVLLAIGFSAGQIQLIDPIRKDYTKLYNEDRLIEKTRVTCIKWVPESSNQFLVSYESGKMYIYNEELTCVNGGAPSFQTFKSGEGYSVYTCKTKSTRNPLYKWDLGESCINEFEFSPCAQYLAVVTRDGLLRVFNYNEMEVIGIGKSYFGSLLCLAWSPDSKFVAVGGEDDLITIWSMSERKIVARGQGHKSWVAALAFDPYITAFDSEYPIGSDSVDDNVDSKLKTETNGKFGTWYRLGSVGQDAQICMWDLMEDTLKHPISKRVSVLVTQSANSTVSSTSGSSNSKYSFSRVTNLFFKETTPSDTSDLTLSQRLSYLTLSDRKKEDKYKKGPALQRDRNTSARSVNFEDLIAIGSVHCPRLNERPLLEPLICKKVALERLTSIQFLEDCFILSCQDGILYVWQRPRRLVNGATEIREGTMV
ncbi:WD repeat-containing protein 20-like [Artemia franciscana]|uniref:Anaphase-promoting complex subunit 4-like WD40 domain-containing protein n=1 Tax=Artemia franciscana TaxID=6661 RepID=A0AA88L628_ARTSF|nr:hypothetical protein QYM36_013103 [Artemia franciscana]KAK2709321.1 hypothetical protein QYM36_013103 [Artemia franciscana]